MKVQLSRRVLFRVAATLVFCTAHALGDETPESADGGAVAFPDFPPVMLAKSRIPDAAESDEDWAGRVAAFTELSRNADNPRQKAEYLLAAANIVLGRQLQPYCTRAAIGLSDADAVAGSPQTLLQKAEQLIAEARALVNGEEAPNIRLTQIAEGLQAFANAQKALLVEEHAADRRRSASSLAPMLEDADKKVAEAARLWQVLLRATDADPSPAMQILDNPMTSPPVESWPYGLFAKVLRCRYQAIQGAWSSALVMLSYIEDQLELWVPDMAHRGDARRLFAYVRFETLKRWYDALPPDRALERKWCATQAESVTREYFSVDAALLRLDPAVPMMVADDVLKAGEPGKPDNEKH